LPDIERFLEEKLTPIHKAHYAIWVYWWPLWRDIFSGQKILQKWEQCNLVQEGQTFLDYGCGTGAFTIPAARIVNTNGQVYALDCFPRQLEIVKDRSKKEKLTNIETILRSKELGIEREAVKNWLIPLKHRLGSFEPFLQGKTADIVNLIANTPYRDFANQVQEAVEAGDEPSLNRFETVMRQYLVHQAIKAFRGTTFHLGTFIAYFILKRTEFENVRAIIIGKMANLDQESIKDMIIYY